MNAEENLTLLGLKLSIDKLTFEIAQQRQEDAAKSRYSDLPEWINLDMAISLKGGAAKATYRQRPFLQPCCGKKYKLVGGRRCWRRDDVIEWLDITDDDGLKNYSKNQNVELPEIYLRRGD
jgi:hypothetical protein